MLLIQWVGLAVASGILVGIFGIILYVIHERRKDRQQSEILFEALEPKRKP